MAAIHWSVFAPTCRNSCARTAIARQWVDATIERFGRLDIAFNYGTIRGLLALVETLGLNTLHEVLELHLKCVFNCTVHELKIMKEYGGAIVNAAMIAHAAGHTPLPVTSESVGGVIGMTRTPATLYSHYGVRISAFCPNLNDPALPPVFPTETTQRLLENIRAGTVTESLLLENRAKMVLRLCSEEDDFKASAGKMTYA
jgi:NAD(P)-dependent dehydrogenase (short-subunit alcohol dehydrogenase family)